MKTNEIIKNGDYAEIVVNSTKYGVQKIKIDLDDIEKIKDKRIFISNEGYKSDLLYAQLYLKDRSNKKVRLHRYLSNCPQDKVVDHINFDTLDNRKKNLKICSNEYNSSKKDIKNSFSGTGYRHISKVKDRNLFRITFIKKRKRVFDKFAKTLEEAIQVRNNYIEENGLYEASI